MAEDRAIKGSTDPRFAGIQNDPKFKNVKKKGLKVKLDDRFSKKDLELKRKAKVDKYGRKIGGESKDFKDFDKYFEKEDKSEDESSSDSEDEDEEEEQDQVKPAAFDRARGEVPEDYTSSESEDSESEMSEEESEEDLAEEVEPTKPESGDPSKTLAVVNLDWDHVRALDLMVTFSSFLPSGGKIEKICVYPSEFGKERMQREEKEGPPREIFPKKKHHHEDESDSDVDIHDLYEEGDADREVDNAALRHYQLERLRYYYAIVYCNNVETGQTIYSNCDGTEYESTANIFDLRYVPEGMEFDDEPRDECTELPKNYKPLEFSTDALQHSNVKLTWDETPTDRVEVSKRAFTQKELEDMDFQAYLASETDGSEEENDNNEEAKNKLKSLVGQSLTDGGQEEEEPDMEITFTPGLDDSKPPAGEDHGEETTIEKVKRKEQERRKSRKQRIKELKRQAEEEKKEKLRSTKNKKQIEDESEAKSKAELELLMMEDEDDTEKSLNKKAHFNMNEILKSEKEKKKRGKYQDKNKIVEDEFTPDLNDPRFNEVFENQDFAIDPSQSEYKSTKAMKEILEERSKRAHGKKRKPSTVDGDKDSAGKTGNQNISNIVNKLKKGKGNNKKTKR